eukprot:TRINITY_DN73959_c0_g1_i1.p1 TRINITY_DN73959_c0_g1~~TRINITY_DN73959_c0_g1_i1.p1  ORF type:complete len:228 (+),score=36.30 TRINITY_DN73959_c0_g1_i1:57-686(+)
MGSGMTRAANPASPHSPSIVAESEDMSDGDDIASSSDPILAFISSEAREFMLDPETLAELEKQEVKYVSCMNAIEVMNDKIATYVDDLRKLNMQNTPECEGTTRAIERTKKDIAERKERRKAKYQELEAIRESLTPLIQRIRRHSFMHNAERQRSLVDTELLQVPSDDEELLKRRRSAKLRVSALNLAVRKRKRTVYSDTDLAALLNTL